MDQTAQELRMAARAARRRPHSEVMDAVDRWAKAWEDPAFGPWKEVQELAGGNYPLRQAILTLAGSARRMPFHRFIQEQLGDSLWCPEPRESGWRMARGYELMGVFLGGGAALASWPVFLLALVVRSAVFARMTGADQRWPVLFRKSFQEIDPELAATIHTGYWPVEDGQRHRALCQVSDLVLAYGSDATMESIKAQVPASTPFLPFGSRLSIAVVGKDMPVDIAACQAAVDAAIYDGAGCLSPQVILVEGDIQRGQEFAAALDRELGDLVQSWPMETRSPGQQMAIRTAREVAAFEEGALVLGPADLRWTVLFSGRTGFEPSPPGRTAQVRVFQSKADLRKLLEPYAAVLQAAGVGFSSPHRRDEFAMALAEMGVSRICPLGQMQLPRLNWNHDGRALLTSLVKFVDLEEG